MKREDFSETFAACDLKIVKCIQLIEEMEICEYSMPILFLDLGPRTFTYEN